MNGLRVEKKAVDAVLYLTDGTQLAGSLYVAATSPLHPGPQTVPELLADGGPVLPLSTGDRGFLLVGRAAVAAVAVADAGGGPDALWVRVPARLRVAGGHRFEGDLAGERGAGTRLSDLVGTPDPWLRLEQPGRVVWAAKAHLVFLEAPGAY